MAIGEDRVQVTKVESTALGGKDSDANIMGAPVPINPSEDALESCGGYVQDNANRDETVGWYRDSGNFVFFDQHNLPVMLVQLLSGLALEFIAEGVTFVVPENYQHIVYKKMTIDGKLILDGKLVVI